MGWWEGELNGRRGVFPDNFVKLLPSDFEKEVSNVFHFCFRQNESGVERNSLLDTWFWQSFTSNLIKKKVKGNKFLGNEHPQRERVALKVILWSFFDRFDWPI